MNQNEIANTYALVGGTAAWKNAGYPMSQPKPPNVAQPNAQQEKVVP